MMTTKNNGDQQQKTKKREINSTPFTGRREIINGKDSLPYPSSSAGLFTERGKSAFFSTSQSRMDSNGYENNAKKRIAEQEFSLVNLATGERTILIQAAICMILLVFYLYIGFIGGITGNGFMDAAVDFDLDVDYEQVEASSQSLWI